LALTIPNWCSAQTAQAFIHLGVVQDSEAALQSLLNALRLLKTSSQIPGLSIPKHLKE
jgi:hypothetical protein